MGLFDIFKQPVPQQDVTLNRQKIQEILQAEDLSPELIDTLVDKMQNKLTEVTEKSEMSYDDFMGEVTDKISTIYTQPQNRLNFCELVTKFISENPEAFNSVRIYASYICYGSIELKLDEYKTTLIHADENVIKKAQKIIERFEKTSKIKRLMYLVASEVVKFGDAFLEKIKGSDGKLAAVAYLPSKDMLFKLDKLGNPEKFYQVQAQRYENKLPYEIFNDLDKSKKGIAFEKYEIVHFNDGTPAGFADNPFSTLAFLWKSLKLIEESLIIHRVTRARRLIVFFLDVTGRTKEQIRRSVNSFVSKLTSIFRINTDEGTLYKNKSVIKQGNDIVIPVTKESATKVQVIPSDSSATNINDVQFYHSRIMQNMLTTHIFGNEKTGKEEYTEKALIRLIRTYQRMLAYTLEDLYTELLLDNGIPDVDVYVQFPSPDINEEIKLIDTIIRRMMVVNQLIATLGVVPPTEWIVKYVFKDLSQPEIQELIKLMEYEKKKLESESSGQEFPSLVEGDTAPQQSNTNLVNMLQNGSNGSQELSGNMEQLPSGTQSSGNDYSVNSLFESFDKNTSNRVIESTNTVMRKKLLEDGLAMGIKFMESRPKPPQVEYIERAKK